jgi:hypothetical protein
MKKLILMALLAGACGGGSDGNHPANPQPTPGGGVGEGAIDGELNVFVLDSVTDAPINGARVQLEVEAGEPLVIQTDATGLAKFDGVTGAQDVSVTSQNHVTASWLGVNGAVVTIALSPVDAPEPAIATGTVTGTITGFADLPLSDGHVLAAVVFYSTRQGNALEDPENQIPQETNNNIPTNLCLKSGLGTSCNYSLKTRTGAQALFAAIYDRNIGAGTQELVGYAVKRGVDVTSGTTLASQNLDLIATDSLIDVTVAFAGLPTDFTEANAIPLIDLGAEGNVLVLAAFNADTPTNPLPPLTGPLAGGTYRMVGASDTGVDGGPTSIQFDNTIDTASTVTLENWLSPASNLQGARASRTFSWAGTSVVTLLEVNTASDRAWDVVVLDGRTLVTLPAIDPDPLTVEATAMTVTLVDVPGFNPADFNARDVQSAAVRLSTASATLVP